MLYRHGLRGSEVINLKVSDVDLLHSRIWMSRMKYGIPVENPISGDELRAIKRCLLSRKYNLQWLFVNQRLLPLTRLAMNYIFNRATEKAKLSIVHPHTLRHSCRFYLANKGYDLRLIQDYLGHRDAKHTAHYTRVVSKRLEKMWL